MRIFAHVLLLFCLVVPSTALAEEEPLFGPPPATLPELISSLRFDKPLNFCGEEVPLDLPDVRERFEKEFLLALWDRAQVILWLKRAGKYMPYIEEMLKENNLPDDLKYIAVIESALLPHVGSSKGAVGFWQFIRGTGRRYGLKINSERDERRNIFYSTNAAIEYLKALHKIFGSWTLTAAGYNMGESRLKSQIERQGVSDYYMLYLPLETQRYVFKIITAKMIFSDPAKYGFELNDDDLYPPEEFDRIKIKCKNSTPLSVVAEAAGCYLKEIKDLNPELRGYELSRGTHEIAVPKGSEAQFQKRYEKLISEWVAKNRKKTYVVKKGDNLNAIAKRFDVSVPALVRWNNLSLNKHIHPGKKLVIYR